MCSVDGRVRALVYVGLYFYRDADNRNIVCLLALSDGPVTCDHSRRFVRRTLLRVNGCPSRRVF